MYQTGIKGLQKIPLKSRLSNNESLKKKIISEAKILYRNCNVSNKKTNIVSLSYRMKKKHITQG